MTDKASDKAAAIPVADAQAPEANSKKEEEAENRSLGGSSQAQNGLQGQANVSAADNNDSNTEQAVTHPVEDSAIDSDPPGAYAVPGARGWGYNTPADFNVSTAPAPAQENNPDNEVLDADAQTLAASGQYSATAYVVEEGAEPSFAEVVHTCFGIDRKRLIALSFGAFVLLVVILSIVLGVLLPKANNQNSQNACGPLCGEDGDPTDPKKLVMGYSCEDWNFNSTIIPVEQDQCSIQYSAAAYGCGCPGIEIPPNPCGSLCQDGKELLEPELLVRAINNVEMTCADWELKSMFDTDQNECVNYNTVGVMCGCKNNDPHPDACGPLCTNGDSPIPIVHLVYGNTCRDWNIMSMNLPKWYHNVKEEECSEYFQDIAYGCGCPGVQLPPDTCNTICQDRRKCKRICEDGSPVPDLDFISRDVSCQGWEYHARMEFWPQVCPLYHMVGAECGCDNTPPVDACGPLCGAGTNVPNPDKEVLGKTCAEWDSTSSFLFPGYGQNKEGASGLFTDCDEYFSKASYGCDCPGLEPPSNGCGKLCVDGSSPPDLSLVVGDRSCADLELTSLFETNPEECSRYRMLGDLCGCEDNTSHPSNGKACFSHESLTNDTFFYAAGSSQYLITFGEGGIFAQLQNQNSMNLIGRFNGYGTGAKENMTIYVDGAACGKYGPRRGQVVVVEDASMTKPTISYVIEPSICTYRAELRVPTYCNSTIFNR